VAGDGGARALGFGSPDSLSGIVLDVFILVDVLFDVLTQPVIALSIERRCWYETPLLVYRDYRSSSASRACKRSTKPSRTLANP
jgi:hypothetical protein